MGAIDRIFENINAGYQYGDFVYNVRFPYFNSCLSISENGKYIRWKCYGESANINTKADLHWIITEIFKVTPEEFEKSKLIKYAGRAKQ